MLYNVWAWSGSGLRPHGGSGAPEYGTNQFVAESTPGLWPLSRSPPLASSAKLK